MPDLSKKRVKNEIAYTWLNCGDIEIGLEHALGSTKANGREPKTGLG